MKIKKRTNFYELWVLCILRANGKTPEDYSRIEGDGGYQTFVTEYEANLIEEIRRRVKGDITSTIPYNDNGNTSFVGINKNFYQIVKDNVSYHLPITHIGAQLCGKEYYYDKYGDFTNIITLEKGNASSLKKVATLINIMMDSLGIEPEEVPDTTSKSPLAPQRMIKRLFFDIETSPMVVYSWRIGNKVSLSPDNIIDTWKIICIAYKWEHEDTVNVISWDEFTDEKDMLNKFVKIANQSDEIVGHNSDHFDIKKFRTRCIANGIRTFPKYRSLDTLTKSREYFAFDSNKLDYIAKFLGVGAKVEHEGFNMWIKCLKGDKEALNKMCEYCSGDIIVLEDVFHAIQHYIKPNTHVGVHYGEGRYSCPVCGNNGLGEHSIDLLKSDVTEKGIISRVMECTECGHTYNISNKSYMDYGKAKLNQNTRIDAKR